MTLGPHPALTLTAQCVGCGKRRDIAPGDVAPDDMPMCEACYSPMVAVKAAARTPGRKRR